eukprot:contig_13666_g3290
MVVTACLAATTRGTPALAPVHGGEVNGASATLVALPRGRSLLPALTGLASRAEEGSGPCSSSACIGRWKGGFMAALFVEGLIGGAAPEEHHDEEGEHGEESHGFPTGYALAVAGFYAILFLEYLVLGKFSHTHKVEALRARDRAAAKGQPSSPPLASAVHPGSAEAATTSDGLVPGVKASDSDYTTTMEEGGGSTEEDGTRGGTLQPSVSTASAHSDGSLATEETDDPYYGSLLEAENVGFFSPNFWRAFLTAFSVAIHVVFESLSLGLGSSWPVVLNTFLAIAAHKWATAASLGVKFEKERLRLMQSVVLIVLWSAVTPAAAGIGAAIDGGVSDKVTGVLLALSAGTFLYIGALEVNAEEFVEDKRDRLLKALVTTLGVGVIMAVTAILSSTGVH